MTRRRRLEILLALIVVLLLAASAAVDLAFGGLPLRQPPAGTTWVLRQYTSGGGSVSLPAGRLTMRFTPSHVLHAVPKH